MLGPSLAAQESGLEKLALFLGAKADGRPTPVTDEAMENALAQSRADKVFALSDAVAAADLPRSLELATRMFASGLVLDDKIERRAQTIALLAIAALGRDVERRLLLKTELERGTRQAEALKTAGVPHFRSEQAVRAAGRLTLDGLQQQLEAVFEADLDLKTSAGDPQALLENLLIRLHLASDRNKPAAARRR
jgi:DNA polymerase III delta subunit